MKQLYNKGLKLINATPVNAFKDKDKDKVPNILDCKPNNPREQGFIHSIGARVARKVGATGIATTIEARGKRSDEIIKVRTEAGHEERLRYEREAAKIRTEQRLKQLKERPQQSTSLWGQFKGGFTPPHKATRLTKSKPTYRYVKKGKHYVRKKVSGGTTPKTTTTIATQPKESLQDYMSKRFKF